MVDHVWRLVSPRWVRWTAEVESMDDAKEGVMQLLRRAEVAFGKRIEGAGVTSPRMMVSDGCGEART